MLKPRYVVWLFAVALGWCAGAVCGQNYTGKPIRIVTYPAGGGQDFGARLIAQGLTATAGWAVIVDNRAGGVIPGETVAKSMPDGYTLLLAGGSLWLAPFLQD